MVVDIAKAEKGFSLIVAATNEYGIGFQGQLPWRLKRDMAFFKGVTTFFGKTAEQTNVVVMGRKTWDSIPNKFKPLANRINVIFSRDKEFERRLNDEQRTNVLVFSDLHEFLNNLPQLYAQNKSWGHVWIIGGSEIYKKALANPLCSQVLLTRVTCSNVQCDTFFPNLDSSKEWELRDEASTKMAFESYNNENIPSNAQFTVDEIVEGEFSYKYELYIRNPDYLSSDN